MKPDDKKESMKVTGESVFAATQIGEEYRAIKLTQANGKYTLNMTTSESVSSGDIFEFAADCISQATNEENIQHTDSVVIGYDTVGVIFRRLSVPAANSVDLERMIRMQAEAVMPLPAGNMQMAWRVDVQDGQKCPVTLVAARKDQLANFAKKASGLKPDCLMLDCEAIVECWYRCFGGDMSTALIINMNDEDCQVCLADNRKLITAAAIDMGRRDIVSGGHRAVQSFVQDVRGLVEIFGESASGDLPVYVLSDGSEQTEQIVGYIRAANVNAKSAMPNTDKFVDTGIQEIYDYRVCIGLASKMLNNSDDRLDIFSGLYEPRQKLKRKSKKLSLKFAAVIFIVTLLLSAMTSYWMDKTQLGNLQAQLTDASGGVGFYAIQQRQSLVKSVSKNRPDMLDLLGQINSSGDSAITLDSVEFKRFKPVNISGIAQSTDALYKFEKSLLESRHISEVKMKTHKVTDKNRKGVGFSISFNYQNFSKSRLR